MSPRESQVSDQRAAGKSEQETADALGISRRTVHTHRDKASKRRGAEPHLSKRQREVVSCLALGLAIDDVAKHLGIARGTAVQHRTLAGLALGGRSAVELTHYAILQGWVRAGDALSPELTDAALGKIARGAGEP
jgi:DNA-binding CsgD family transcriptional regulator